MTEGEFIRFYKKRNISKNQKEVKKRIDLFWNALLKALDKGEKVTLKNWGVFEKKQVKPRKIMMPKMDKAAFTEAKNKIRFRVGTELQNIINRVDADE